MKLVWMAAALAALCLEARAGTALDGNTLQAWQEDSAAAVRKAPQFRAVAWGQPISLWVSAADNGDGMHLAELACMTAGGAPHAEGPTLFVVTVWNAASGELGAGRVLAKSPCSIRTD